MNKKIKNLILRILNAVIWVPVVVLGVLIIPGGDHFLGRLLLLMFSIISGFEMGTILQRKEPTLVRWPFACYGGMIPFFTILFQQFPQNSSFYVFLILLAILTIFTCEVFIYSERSAPGIISRLSSRLFAIVYPGLFFSFMIMLPTLNYPVVVFAMFFLITMLNDTMAYFVGLIFGKITNTRGIVAVSPKKSLIGFVGGILASAASVLVVYYWILPEAFGQRGLIYVIGMGFCCGIAGIIGDLFESLLKRSVDMKDSGNFFMGRGGVLDSFDSLMFVAPVYYYFMLFI
ncbi:MAG: phosphatidate cytidylyltransferase [Spirochaetia bacterium]